MAKVVRFLGFSLLFLSALLPLSAQTVAFVGTENRTGSPSFDYLGAIVEGVVLFDLSSIGSVTIVERKRLETVMAEQRLQLSGFTEPGAEGRRLEVGKLLSADYLISLDYTLFGDEVAFNLRLTETETGEVNLFSVRGAMENEIHGLSEQVARALTGRGFNFVNPAEQRSLLTLRDINPGILTLYCNLENAEILMNGRFVGYTIGDLYTPMTITDLDPGAYTMTIRLSRDFGMVELPEFTFHDWEEEITIRPGRTTVHRSIVEHFSSVVYRESQLLRERMRLNEETPSFNTVHVADFVDREGRHIPISLEISGSRDGAGTTAEAVIDYDGRMIRLSVDPKTPEAKRELEKVKIVLEMDHYTNYSEVTYEIWRTDIWQGMHREE